MTSLTYRGTEYFRQPLSPAFPPASEDELAILRASIKQIGLLEPIKLVADAENTVIDGWNRLQACQSEDVDANFTTVVLDADLYELTLGLNLARRHLTASQKALIAGELTTAQSGRPSTLNGAPIDSMSSPRTLAQNSERYRIARSTAAKGKKVAHCGNKELIENVRLGRLSMNDAASLAKRNREQQNDEIKRRLDEGKEWNKEVREGISAARKMIKLHRFQAVTRERHG
jgi:hypothetical protein